MIRNSAASGNAFIGVQSTSAAGKSSTNVIVSHAAATTNSTGISSTGQGSDLTIAYSNVAGNNIGITFTAPAGINSYQTNQLLGNITTNGTPSSNISLQ